jgi:hypothetical protein
MADDEVEAERIEDEGDPQGSSLEWTATLIRILAVWMYATTAVSAASIAATLFRWVARDRLVARGAAGNEA